MESLEIIAEKMEAPLSFAAGDSFGRIELVKNLETVMTTLVRQLLDGIHSEASETRKREIQQISLAMLNLFDGYDSLVTELKKGRLAKAIHHLSQLKSILKSQPGEEHGSISGLEKREGALDFLSLPIQSVRGSARGLPNSSPEKSYHHRRFALFPAAPV